MPYETWTEEPSVVAEFVSNCPQARHATMDVAAIEEVVVMVGEEEMTIETLSVIIVTRLMNVVATGMLAQEDMVDAVTMDLRLHLEIDAVVVVMKDVAVEVQVLELTMSEEEEEITTRLGLGQRDIRGHDRVHPCIVETAMTLAMLVALVEVEGQGVDLALQ